MKILRPPNPSTLLIRCDRCDKPVERVTAGFSEYWCGYVITAFCHGDMEEMRVSEELLNEEPGIEQQITSQQGAAFVQAKLANQPDE